jgi:hypothetical protein
MHNVNFSDAAKAKSVCNLVKAALTEEGLRFHFDDGQAVAIMKFTGLKFTYDCLVFCSDEFVVAQMRYPFTVPAERLAHLYEFINTINTSAPVGNMELLGDKTTLSVKVGLSIKNYFPDNGVIIELLSRAFQLTDANASKIELELYATGKT